MIIQLHQICTCGHGLSWHGLFPNSGMRCCYVNYKDDGRYVQCDCRKFTPETIEEPE